MKKFLLLLLAAPAISFAQSATPTPPPGPPPGGMGFHRPNVPPELRDRFRAAKDKALQDPKVRELRERMEAAAKDFRTAMRDAMIKADPGLAEEFKKLPDERDERKDGNDDKNARPGRDGKGQGGDKKWDRNGHRGGFGDLSEGERQRLMAARETAKDDPAVVAARQKRDQAKTPEERQAAAKEFHEAMRAAMLKVDPTLAPILDKIKPPGSPENQPPTP